MNFLAHVFLAGDDPALRLGGMLGDFVKGPLPCGLPPDVARGVELHRRIDSYTDAHPAFRQSRSRVSPSRRRYAGIMVDLFYDHFLALHCQRFHAQPLASFTAGVYALLETHGHLLPPRLAQILPRMRADDWLSSYRELGSIHTALDRMAGRLTRPEGLIGSAAELEGHYGHFEQDFLAFLPDAKA